MKDQYEIEDLMTRMMEMDHSLCDMDDMSLYYEVSSKVNPLINGMRFDTVMKNRVELGIPSMSSVSRVKRKIQSKRPDLRQNDSVTRARVVIMEEMIDYAKS